MTDLMRAAAQQALEILERLHGGCTDSDDGTVEAITIWVPEIIDALRAALAEPVQQGCDHCNHPLYAATKCRVCGRVTEPTPPQRKPLTDEEIDHAANNILTDDPVQWWRKLARAVERAHGIKE